MTVGHLAIGGLTLDDVVSSNGTIVRAAPGGNALYSALGARLWSGDVTLLTFAGEDYPEAYLERLTDHGIDVSWIARLPGPSIHLWVLYESGGDRQISYQHRSGTLAELPPVVKRAAPALAAAMRNGSAIHVAALPVALQVPILDAVRPLGIQLTLDSIEARGTVGGDLLGYRATGVLHGVTAFLPSRAEFDIIRGDAKEEVAAASLLASNGMRVLIVKDGRAGVVIYDPAGRVVRVPAVPTAVVDPTGAGDAFCGGFMVGLAETGDPVEAAIRGTVSASVTIERHGALHLLDVSRVVVKKRRDALARQLEAGV